MAAEAGFGVVPLDQVRTMDGLTLIKGLMEGRFPAPPISEVLGFDIAEAESGRVVFTYTPVFGHYNPLGAVHGGVAATLLAAAGGLKLYMLAGFYQADDPRLARAPGKLSGVIGAAPAPLDV